MDHPADEPRAFISYAHAESEIAVAVQQALEARGWHVFRDVPSIEPGEPLPQTISAAIDDAELFLPLISDAYRDSPACRHELNQALMRRFNGDEVRVVALRVEGAEMLPELKAALWVEVAAGEEDQAVERVLRRRQDADASALAARPDVAYEVVEVNASTPTSASDPGDLRAAIRYARELEALAAIDHSLVEAQRVIQGAAASHDPDAYSQAHREWEEAWVRRTSPVTDNELLSRVQAVGSLLSEVVHSDRTPREIRPFIVLRAIASARAALGYAMRGEPLPPPSFPGHVELRDLLGKGDGRDDPVAPLRERLAELATPVFHPAPA